MRLTLRTLLAYLDDILEPRQTKEIGQKVADSHFATSLINRIREVLRRRRLTAPPLSGPEVGLDPNTVAEYLDNTLPPEKIADVEKTCLESDVHLAEMAGAHQILTLVLGEPVEIVPESRERMYALTATERVVAPPAPVAEKAKQPEAATPQPKKKPEPKEVPPQKVPAVEEDDFRSGIPDYLRKPPLWKRALPYAAVAAAVLLAVFVFLPNDPAESEAPQNVDVAQNTVPEDPLPPQEEPDIAPGPPEIEEVVESDDEPFVVEGLPTEADTDPLTELDVDATPPPDEEIDSSLVTTNPVTIDPIDPLDLPEGDSVFEDTVVESATTNEAPPLPIPDVDEPALTDNEPVETDVDTETTEAVESETTTETTDQVAALDPKPEIKQPVVEPVETAPKAPAVPPVTMQYVTTPAGILLFDDPEVGGWLKLPPRSIIHAGDRLVLPEPFSASLRISSGNTHLTLMPGALNGTSIELMGATEASPCTIRVHRGRMVFRGSPDLVGQDGEPVTIGFAVGEELWQVKFLTPDAVWGLEINPRQPDEFEQDLGGNTYTGALYVSRGEIQFSDGDQLKVVKTGPNWISLTPGQRDAPFLTLPSWLGRLIMTAEQKQQARLFAREFDELQPIEISLVGAIDGRRTEVSSLAVKCFALCGNHRLLTRTLTSSNHKEARRAAMDGLRDWLPTDPSNAEKLRESLHQVFHEEEADIIYRLLWGFSKEDAKKLEPSEELITLMGHEQLVIRELAFDAVQRLPGIRTTRNYRPTDPEQKRNPAIDRWRKFVERNNGLVKQQ